MPFVNEVGRASPRESNLHLIGGDHRKQQLRAIAFCVLRHRQRSGYGDAARMCRTLEMRIIGLIGVIERTVQKRSIVRCQLIAIIGNGRTPPRPGSGYDFAVILAPR